MIAAERFEYIGRGGEVFVAAARAAGDYMLTRGQPPVLHERAQVAAALRLRGEDIGGVFVQLLHREDG